MSILNNYNLTFVNRTFTFQSGKQTNEKLAFHNVTSPFEDNGFLGYFLNQLRNSEDDIIADINTVISEGFYDEERQLEISIRGLYVDYTANSLKFFDDFEGNLLQEIPFSDMIQILQLWKTFNQTPPFHNQIL